MFEKQSLCQYLTAFIVLGFSKLQKSIIFEQFLSALLGTLKKCDVGVLNPVVQKNAHHLPN